MRKYLETLIARKKEEVVELKKRSAASEDIKEVRAIGETLDKLASEIREAEEELAKLPADDGGEGRSAVPSGATLNNAQVRASFSAANQQNNATDPRDTEEYRNAFMNFVCRGVAIPAELRDNATTTATDAGAAIPTSYMNEIIQNLESYGNVYALVRKLNVQGGVSIPIASLKPEASWVGEAASESKKLEAKEAVTFQYHGVECKIAQSLLVNVTSLAAFQKLFVTLAAEAIVKAIEIAIFNGDGNLKPMGILKDTRVKSANAVTMSAEEFTSWDGWHKKVKAKMKKAYRDGVFFMNQATFDGYIDGMTDQNGQPVGRTNYGINGEEAYRFMGKNVETVEDGCLPAYDDAASGEVVAVFVKPTDYVINSNMSMTTVKWTDHDTNEVKNKAIMIVDGKLADANGVILIKKA